MFQKYLIVFLISGFWHGAGWNYILWGFLHAVFLIVGVLLEKLFGDKSFSMNVFFVKIISGLRLIGTFCLVWFTWIFFRSRSLDQAKVIIGNLMKFKKKQIGLYVFNDNTQELLLSFFAIFLLCIILYFSRDIKLSVILKRKGQVYSWSFYLSIIFIIIIFGSFHNSGEFIYFQF
jgi:alginate O-acetyltransferase complex protein AlgI